MLLSTYGRPQLCVPVLRGDRLQQRILGVLVGVPFLSPMPFSRQSARPVGRRRAPDCIEPGCHARSRRLSYRSAPNSNTRSAKNGIRQFQRKVAGSQRGTSCPPIRARVLGTKPRFPLPGCRECQVLTARRSKRSGVSRACSFYGLNQAALKFCTKIVWLQHVVQELNRRAALSRHPQDSNNADITLGGMIARTPSAQSQHHPRTNITGFRPRARTRTVETKPALGAAPPAFCDRYSVMSRDKSATVKRS
jgi:hypothetical protein